MITFALSLIFAAAGPVAIHGYAVDEMNRSHFAQAAVLCRRALARQDPASLEAALLLRDLSRAERGEGYLEKALDARRRELAILKTRLGEQDANIALALDGVGEIYFEQHRFTAARHSFESALRIAEKTLAPESPHLAAILNDLGAAYYQDHRYSQAARLIRRSLAIRETKSARANLAQTEKAIARFEPRP